VASERSRAEKSDRVCVCECDARRRSVCMARKCERGRERVAGGRRRGSERVAGGEATRE